MAPAVWSDTPCVSSDDGFVRPRPQAPFLRRTGNMLENFTTRRAGKAHVSAAAELQALIATAREERAALGEMLTQVSLRSANLTQTGRSLAQLEKQASGATEHVEALSGRLANIDERARTVETLDARVQQLLAQVQDATLEAQRRSQTSIEAVRETEKRL